MKSLIKKILKESSDDRIFNTLSKNKLLTYNSVINFLTDAGYSYNESQEIYKGYFKIISGMDLTPINWLNFYFNPDQLDIIDNNVHPVLDPESIYYSKNDSIIMEYFKIGKAFWFDYSKIWLPINNIIGIHNNDIRDILKVWLKDTFNIEAKKINYQTGGW